MIYIGRYSGGTAHTNAAYGRALMCAACNALIQDLPEAKRAHDAFHENHVSRQEAQSMSACGWCDPGDHAFKLGVPGAQKLNGYETLEDGTTIQVVWDVCPKHRQGTFQTRTDTRPALDATPLDD